MAAERDNSQVLLVFTPTVADVVGLLSQSRETRPDMGVVVALPGPANGSLGAALAAGAHEIVILPAVAVAVLTLKAGSPGATCTWTVTLRASMPSNATVATRWTMPNPDTSRTPD